MEETAQSYSSGEWLVRAASESVPYRRGTATLYMSQNTKWCELGFSAVVGNSASEVRFERTTLS
jgi:hypothetical protein